VAEFRWRGVSRDGRASVGGMAIDPAHLPAVVEDRFKTGWRELTVTRDGIEVAGIWLNPSNLGRRDWWAEGDGRSLSQPANCEACWHLWSYHGPDGCGGKVFPSHSLTGERCPCKHTPSATQPAGTETNR
jgi:hypothetical protein